MSARQKAEETLRQSKGIVQALLEALPDATVIIDASGKIVLANSQAETMFGYAHEELQGQHEKVLLPSRFHKNYQQERKGYFSPAHIRKQAIVRELWGQRKDGTEFSVEIALSHLTTELKTLVVSSIRDTTEQKQRAIELCLSRPSLHVALDVASLATWGWDEATQTKSWTPQTKAIFGLSSDVEISKRLFRSLLHPDDLSRYELAWTQAIDPGGTHIYELEYRIRRVSDGAERWIRSRAAVEFEEQKLIRVLGALRDITEEKLADQALRVSEIRYRRLFETAHDGVLLLDPETRKITDANPYMTTLLGYSHTQLVGKELFEIGLLSDEEASQEMVRRLKETHLVRYENLPLRSQVGRRQEVEVVANLYDENGQAVIQCNIRDITERKVAQEQIENLNLRLQRAVAEAQHRIKNNLQMLSALVELQLPSTGETVPISELKRIGHHIRTLAALHDLMSVDSPIQAGRDTISLKAALETLVPMLQATSGGRKIHLVAEEMTISLRQGSSLTLLVNELVSNALKHGQGEITVGLTLLPGAMAQLAVRDQGPGFPVGFDPQTAANTGMELIESMGRWDLRGEVSYENPQGDGAQIVLVFPLPDQG